MTSIHAGGDLERHERSAIPPGGTTSHQALPLLGVDRGDRDASPSQPIHDSPRKADVGGIGRALAFISTFEHALTLVLAFMLATVVVLSTIELGTTIAQDVATPPRFLISTDHLLDIFGKFMLVLIGIELLETMRSLYAEGHVRAQVVLTVALIALARKVIVLEPEHLTMALLVGVAALLVALSFAYWVLGRRRSRSDT